MQIYDTLSEKKTPLPKPGKKPLNIFVCGPTVYDLSHIGHARTYIVFDAFLRYLKFKKYKIFYLQNITDIDDRIIARARELKIHPLKLSEIMARAYFKDMQALGINSVNKYAKATKFIKQISSQVTKLIDKGFAYKIGEDGYYFDISKFSDYGKLSHRTTEEAEDSISRIDDNIQKRNKGDFCLWKLSKAQINADKNASRRGKKTSPKIIDGEPLWQTELGLGRPGWHIEDTAITESFFGPQYDIHGGGIDLKFPHHEAEIAEEESISGKKPLAKIWMHTGILSVNGQKMSKSLGNFITIQDFLKKYPANLLRFMVLSHHYRSPMEFSETLANSNMNALKSMENLFLRLDFVIKKKVRSTIVAELQKSLKSFEEEFQNYMEDDFNTGGALGTIFNFVNSVNKSFLLLNSKQAAESKKAIKKHLEILGIYINPPKIPLKISRLAAKRELFRTNKQFIQSDTFRKKINELGYEVEDTAMGPLILKNF